MIPFIIILQQLLSTQLRNPSNFEEFSDVFIFK